MVIVFCLITIAAANSQSDDKKNEKQEAKKDSSNKKDLSLDAYPYAFYTPETELAMGQD